jgi:serine/threonine protein kinase
MSTQKASAPAAGRALSSKDLMKMMVKGEKAEVLTYLRTLPVEERGTMRRKLLKGLEAMQNRKTGEVSSGSESSESNSKMRRMSITQGDSADEATRAVSPNRGGRSGSVASAPLSDVPLQFQSSVDRANTELAGKFRVTEVIGKGGFGTVLKGTSLETGEYVAVKQIDKFMIDAVQLPGIKKEAEILKRLNHPNIVKIYSFMETPNTLYFVLEYVEHGSLAGLLKKYGVFPEHLIASYTEQMLRGLKYLHEEGIIHRDIKGDNILITKDGKVKLADFGTAKLEDAEKKTQTVVGTPYWMAPEVIEMSACGPTSDIWSLGCTVIELLTGAPPYFELGPMSALFNIVEDRHPPLPDNLSDLLRSFLKVCFKKDPRQRPTATELVEHKWIRQFAQAASDIETVSGTLRLHNQPGGKKSVLSIFGDSANGSASNGSADAPASGRKDRDRSADSPASTSSAASSPSTGPVSPRESKSGALSRKSNGTVSSATAASPGSSKAASPSSKKISTKLSKAKTATVENQKAISELQAQYDSQKLEKDKAVKERKRLEEQLVSLRKESSEALAQLNGLNRLLRNLALEHKSAKQSLALVRTMQDTLGRDTYIKLSYGHVASQTKSIRPAPILDAVITRPRSGSV